MPKKTKKDKLRIDDKRKQEKNTQSSHLTTSYTFTDSSSYNVPSKKPLQEAVVSTKFLKSDLFKTFFLTFVGIGFELFLFFFWKQ